MSFLRPAWLLLSFAALVPIAIHLLRRRIGRRVELPTARYLARAEAEHSRELKLRNLLLMLLRVAVILLLAVAAARPFAAVPGGERAPAALAVVLDNTLSSGAVSAGVRVLDDLRNAARAPLGRLTAADRGWLITADGTVRSGNRDALLARLDSVAPLPGAGNLPHALSLAAAAVQGSGLPGEVAVLTDGQATQWRDSLVVPGVRVAVYLPSAPPPPNRAVVDAEPEPLRWTEGAGSLNLAVLSPDSALYQITIDGRPSFRGVVEPDGHVRAPIVTTLRGWFAGTVETERDELPLDDVRHFAAFAGEPPAVTVNPEAGTFAVTAVATLVSRGRLRQGAGIELTPADRATRLPALLIAPADPVRVVAANRALERLGVPWRFEEHVVDSVAVTADSALFAGMFAPDAMRRYRLVRTAPDSVIDTDTLALVSGEPWLVAGERFVVLASALDPAHTTLPVTAAFIPWLERTLAHRLTPDAIGIVHVHPGDSLTLPSWAERLDSRPEASGRHFTFDAPSVHFLTRGGSRVGAVVVNPPRTESMLDRLTPEAMRERIISQAVSVTTSGEGLDRALLATRGRRELTGFALLLAGALLLVELVVRRQQGTAARSGTAAG